MTRYLTRDRWAIAAAVVVPLAVAAILIPWRGSWPNTNVALLLVVAVVAVAALGNRIAGALAAVSAAAWFDFFFTQPYERFTIGHSSRSPTPTTWRESSTAPPSPSRRAPRTRLSSMCGSS